MLVFTGTAAAAADAGWSAYGGDAGGQRYSPLTQINPANVATLRVAWTFRTGELGKGLRHWQRSAFETTPVLVDGLVVTGSPIGDNRAVQQELGIVRAFDARSGALHWRGDPIPRVPSNPVFTDWPAGATANGLVFIAASFDDRIRGFSTDTGELLWQAKLPAGGQAMPMTCAVAGRQFVVIAAGGYKDASTRGDHLVACALP